MQLIFRESLIVKTDSSNSMLLQEMLKEISNEANMHDFIPFINRLVSNFEKKRFTLHDYEVTMFLQIINESIILSNRPGFINKYKKYKDVLTLCAQEIQENIGNQ